MRTTSTTVGATRGLASRAGEASFPIESEHSAQPDPRPVAVVLDFVAASPGGYESLVKSLGLELGGPGLPGCRFNWARSTPDGLRVMEVWDSRDLFEAAMTDKTLPAVRAAGLPNPEVTCYEVHGYLTAGRQELARSASDSAWP